MDIFLLIALIVSVCGHIEEYTRIESLEKKLEKAREQRDYWKYLHDKEYFTDYTEGGPYRVWHK